jgi:glycosyltransferase involved in cell wall biosynthesis
MRLSSIQRKIPIKPSQTLDSQGVCDVLMIINKRPEYLALSLPALLDSGDETLRVWIWQNGDDEAVTRILNMHLNHERIYKVFRSPRNEGLRAPTNWLWSESDADYIGKVDDDILVPSGWASTLKKSHERVRHFGALACWTMHASDYVEEKARHKISRHNGEELLESPWVPGCAYLMKRVCLRDGGFLSEDDTFPGYCYRLAWLGWLHGWHLPLLQSENMDDPRSSHCILKTQEDFEQLKPLTAKRLNLKTLEEWKEFNRRSAEQILQGSKKPGKLYWPRSLFRRALPRRQCGASVK